MARHIFGLISFKLSHIPILNSAKSIFALKLVWPNTEKKHNFHIYIDSLLPYESFPVTAMSMFNPYPRLQKTYYFVGGGVHADPKSKSEKDMQTK